MEISKAVEERCIDKKSRRGKRGKPLVKDDKALGVAWLAVV
jgi:hypothetical protein